MRGWATAKRRSSSAVRPFKGLPLRPAAFTFARRIGFIGAIACAASLAGALAGEPKPDGSIKTKTFEAKVFLDGKIKADAALSADCLAEGKKWMDKSAAEAEAIASRTRSFSGTAAGHSSAATTAARWSMAAMSASSGPTTWTPTARIRIPTSTPSCGTQARRSASVSAPSSPRPPITARP